MLKEVELTDLILTLGIILRLVAMILLYSRGEAIATTETLFQERSRCLETARPIALFRERGLENVLARIDQMFQVRARTIIKRLSRRAPNT